MNPDDYERRRAALDEYLADMEWERQLNQHIDGECDENCPFCEEQKWED